MSKKNIPPPTLPSPTPWWPVAAGLFLLAFALLEIYGPALSGPFLFDDRYLPFLSPGFADNPLRAWVAGVRPMLMVTYWMNTRMFGLDPYWFHFINLVMHGIAGACVWLIAMKLLNHRVFAALCTLVFLVHPLQTEAVGYIAGRSDVAADVLLRYLGGLSVSPGSGDPRRRSASDYGVVWNGGADEGAHDRAGRGAVADRLLLQPRVYF